MNKLIPISLVMALLSTSCASSTAVKIEAEPNKLPECVELIVDTTKVGIEAAYCEEYFFIKNCEEGGWIYARTYDDLTTPYYLTCNSLSDDEKFEIVI